MRGLIILIGILLFSLDGNSQMDAAQKVRKVLSEDDFSYATAGISVRDLNGKEIIQENGKTKMIPASSLKLISSFTALNLLGEQFQYKTKVGYNGFISSDGNLQGDIVIIGSGDPTLGSSRFGPNYKLDFIFDKIVSAIRKKGIKCIDGNIQIRTNVFEGQAISPNWPHSDIANYYGGGAWAINFNENKYDLTFKVGVEGNRALIKSFSPEIPFLKVESEVTFDGPNSGDNAYIYGDPYHYNKIVRGTIPTRKKPFKIKGAIPNPPLTFAIMLGNKLEKKGIKVGGWNVSPNPIKKNNFRELVNFESPPLTDIVKEANFESINLFTDSFIRMIGKKVKKEGSIKAGSEVFKEDLLKSGADERSFHIEDGSGLSPRNTISPSTFTYFLSKQAKRNGVEKLLKYIPQTGVSGTVINMLKARSAQKNFYLKSGSMGGVLSYTGFFKSQKGKWYSISMISNNHSVSNTKIRRKFEEICEVLYFGI